MDISVLCVAYNQESYIRDALEGIVKQKTTCSIEVLVHDDASTDNTPTIIREYAERFPGLIHPVIQQENQVSQGRDPFFDVLIPMAQGKYIALCEGDDCWIDPNKLQRQFNFLENNVDYSACIHNAVIKYGSHDLYFLSEKETGDHEKTANTLIMEGGGRLNPTASFFFRSGLVGEFRKAHPPVGDHFMLMELAAHGKVWWMQSPMSVYRVLSDGSFTSRNTIRSEEGVREYYGRYRFALDWYCQFTNNLYSDALVHRQHFQDDLEEKELCIARYFSNELSFLKMVGHSVDLLSACKAFIAKRFNATAVNYISFFAVTVRALFNGTYLSTRHFEMLRNGN